MEMDVAPALLPDIKFIDHLQKRNAEELSFYPTSAFEREIHRGRILLARVGGEPAGYLYFGAMKTTLRIHQACIEYDLRGQLYGAELIRHLRMLCAHTIVSSIVLRCGSDIAANGFWAAMGFRCIAVRQGGARRMRDINTWSLALQPELFATIEVAPSTREQDARAWTRARKIGLSSSRFIRGRGMGAYRDAVEKATKPPETTR